MRLLLYSQLLRYQYGRLRICRTIWQLAFLAFLASWAAGLPMLLMDIVVSALGGPRWLVDWSTVIAIGLSLAWVLGPCILVDNWLAARIRERSEQCRVCFYPLVNLAKGEDGRTVCPECGAAWRLDSKPDD